MLRKISNSVRKYMQTSISRWCCLIVLGLILSITPELVRAQEIAISHCNGSCPAYQSKLAATRATVVVHKLYAAGINGETGLADWVAYHLSKDAVGVASLLPRFWQLDNLLNSIASPELIELVAPETVLAQISAADSPYGQSEPVLEKEQRVRLAPMSSFANTPYWPELNNVSNMLPMPAPLRLGAWLRLEQALNELVARQEDLFMLTGPLYLITQALSTASSNTSFNPAAYFKIVVSKSGVASFVFPENLAQQAHFCDQLGKLEQIESMSDLEFFPERDLAESSQLIAELGCSR